MNTIAVAPRETPAERADAPVRVDVDEDLVVNASILDDWVTPRQSWTLLLREGHEFGRPNNVEAALVFAAGEQTSGLQFRLDQLDTITDTGAELVLTFEERDGVAKLARLTQNGLDVELFHILTYT